MVFKVEWTPGVSVIEPARVGRVLDVGGSCSIRCEEHNFPLDEVFAAMHERVSRSPSAVFKSYAGERISYEAGDSIEVKSYKYDSCYGCGAPPRPGSHCDYCGRAHW